MAYFLAIIICISALIQGGYYPTNYLVVGTILTAVAAASAIKRKTEGVAISDLLLWALFMWYVCTSLLNQYDLYSLSKAMLPGLCAVLVVIFKTLCTEERQKVISLIVTLSFWSAILAILSYCGVLHITGGVVSKRLQFTFQYANAAGSWFAAMATVAQDEKKPELEKCSLPCIVTLMLTRSIGAITVYSILQFVYQAWISTKKNWRLAFIRHIIAVSFAVAFYFAREEVSVVLLLCLYALSLYGDRFATHERILQAFSAVMFTLLLIGAPVALTRSDRIRSAAHTMVERIVQIIDGLKICISHPLTGVGAGNWNKYYHYYQTAQYISETVHSSIIQLGVDAGVLGVILGILFVLFSFRNCRRSGATNIAALLILGHSLADFTLQFFPIAGLLVLLLYCGDDLNKHHNNCCSILLLMNLCICVVCVILAVGFFQNKTLKQMIEAKAWSEGVLSYERWRPLYGEYMDAKELYVIALYETDQLDRVVQETNDNASLTLDEIAIRAETLFRVKGKSSACEFLLDELSKQHYRVELYSFVSKTFEKWEADESYIVEYNRLVEEANVNISILGALKGDQVYIEYINTERKEEQTHEQEKIG